jgi:hypothetical protein
MGKFAVTFEGLPMDSHMTKHGLAEGVEYLPTSTPAGAGMRKRKSVASAPR